MEIRKAELSDVEAITGIFNFYIESTNARFEEQPFSYEDRVQWFSQFSPGSRYQVYAAVEKGNLVGFASSQPYRAMPAFSDTVEVTVYLAPQATMRGLGSLLYSELLGELGNLGVHRALSGIALPNEASVALHKKFGFREVGVFNEYAKKHGQHLSSMWMEKAFDT